MGCVHVLNNGSTHSYPVESWGEYGVVCRGIAEGDHLGAFQVVREFSPWLFGMSMEIPRESSIRSTRAIIARWESFDPSLDGPFMSPIAFWEALVDVHHALIHAVRLHRWPFPCSWCRNHEARREMVRQALGESIVA